jgi:hypothetical protein
MPPRPQRWTVCWFACAILISAFLVFQVQPVISKTILPWFGGSPAVWTTCMLFFQVLLFAGYAYAHVTTRLLGSRWQGLLHFALILAALCVLPISPDPDWKPTGHENPTLRILAILLTNVGLPYFLLSSTGPLLQAWFASAVRERSPYRLYALSNVGSLGALLTYPFVVEPALTTESQGRAWSLGFCMFATLCGYLAVRQRGASPSATSDDEGRDNSLVEEPIWRRRLGWVLWPAFASVMLLATTNYVCQDIAVIPFLWIVPLSLYLLTFIICFDREAWYSRKWCGGIAAIGLIIINISILNQTTWRLPILLAIYFATMFFVCMVCHGELVRTKPHPRFLTSFYLMSAGGGALGGLFVGVACPLLFSTHLEMNLCLLVGTVLCSGIFLLDAKETWLGDTPPRRAMGAMGYCAVFFLVLFTQFGRVESGVIQHFRNFYGVLMLKDSVYGTKLIHGRIVHGFQFRHPTLQHLPTTYYGEESGVGLALTHYRQGHAKRVGAVGLGCGTVATYGANADYFRFYEINPTVLDIARQHFTFLANCQADHDVVLGDARISMEREPAQQFDVLILDAFSGDSIPTHLLTREACDVYLRHLQPGGVIAVHISNQHVDLEPVVERLADGIGFDCVRIENEEKLPQTAASHWMLMTANREFLELAEIRDHSLPVAAHPKFPLWTDQYNNIVQLLRVY